MHKTHLKRLILAVALALLIVGPAITVQKVKADDGNIFYDFDNEDYWKEYTEWGYPLGSWLPCSGSSLSSCVWVWKPWYRHGTSIPDFDPEAYDQRTVSGYALMMHARSAGEDLDGGIFRVENVQMCHTYQFTMYSRSGLEPAVPASNDAQMQIGISPTGFAPGQVVLTDADFAKIVWSDKANPVYTYQNLSVQAEAQANTISVFTRANPGTDNSPYFFWDEGSFTEVAHTGDLVDVSQPLPGAYGGLTPTATPAAISASISWTTSSGTLGQVLYREVGSSSTPIEIGPYKIYLPLVLGGRSGEWLASPVQNWTQSHTITLSGLKPDTTYEYVVVSYGAYSGNCTTLISDSTSPLTFTTLTN